MKSRVCGRCGWHHFGVSIEYAEAEIAKFNAFYDTLTPQDQKDWYGGKKSSLSNYDSCMRCGNSYLNFHDELPQDEIGDGHTISPIIMESK